MPDIINQFGALIGVGTLLVGGFVYLYSTAKRGRQDVIRQDNADLRASNQEMRSQQAGYMATIKANTETIDRLREIATQTPAVTKLIDMNNKQQELTNKQHNEVIRGLTELTMKIGELAEAINSSHKEARK